MIRNCNDSWSHGEQEGVIGPFPTSTFELDGARSNIVVGKCHCGRVSLNPSEECLNVAVVK